MELRSCLVKAALLPDSSSDVCFLEPSQTACGGNTSPVFTEKQAATRWMQDMKLCLQVGVEIVMVGVERIPLKPRCTLNRWRVARTSRS